MYKKYWAELVLNKVSIPKMSLCQTKVNDQWNKMISQHILIGITQLML